MATQPVVEGMKSEKFIPQSNKQIDNFLSDPVKKNEHPGRQGKCTDNLVETVSCRFTKVLPGLLLTLLRTIFLTKMTEYGAGGMWRQRMDHQRNKSREIPP